MPIRRLTALFIVFLASPAWAEGAALGRFGDWDTYKLSRDQGATCYAMARPKLTQPKKLNRDETYFMVTVWPKRAAKPEPSIVAGYTYRGGSKVDVTVGKSKFGFFTKGDGAWLAQTKDEARLINAMKAGKALSVQGISARGTKTQDNYSLPGFARALDKIQKACK